MPTSRTSWRKTFIKRLIKKLLLHPGTLLPLGFGIFLLFVTGGAGIAAALGGLSALGGAGHVLFRLLFADAGAIGKEALEEIQREAERKLNRDLDILHDELTTDRDNRTQQLLRQLRGLMHDLKQPHMWERVDRVSAEQLMRSIDNLCEISIKKLRDQLALFHSMRHLATEVSRLAASNQRETLITEVEQNVEQLSDLIARIARLKQVSSESQAGHIRAEIAQSVHIAEAVNERLRSDSDIVVVPDLTVPADIHEQEVQDEPDAKREAIPE